MRKAKKVMVTLFRGGTDEKTIPIEEVEIPDLWHIAQRVRTGRYMELPYRKIAYKLIIQTWHTASWLKDHIQRNEGRPKTKEEEQELLKAMLKKYESSFWFKALEKGIKPKGRKKPKRDIIRCYHHHTSNQHPACFNTRKENRGPSRQRCQHGHSKKEHPGCFHGRR